MADGCPLPTTLDQQSNHRRLTSAWRPLVQDSNAAIRVHNFSICLLQSSRCMDRLTFAGRIGQRTAVVGDSKLECAYQSDGAFGPAGGGHGALACSRAIAAAVRLKAVQEPQQQFIDDRAAFTLDPVASAFEDVAAAQARQRGGKAFDLRLRRGEAQHVVARTGDEE